MGIIAMCLEQSGQTNGGEVEWWSGHCRQSGRLRLWLAVLCCGSRAGLGLRQWARI